MCRAYRILRLYSKNNRRGQAERLPDVVIRCQGEIPGRHMRRNRHHPAAPHPGRAAEVVVAADHGHAAAGRDAQLRQQLLGEAHVFHRVGRLLLQNHSGGLHTVGDEPIRHTAGLADGLAGPLGSGDDDRDARLIPDVLKGRLQAHQQAQGRRPAVDAGAQHHHRLHRRVPVRPGPGDHPSLQGGEEQEPRRQQYEKHPPAPERPAAGPAPVVQQGVDGQCSGGAPEQEAGEPDGSPYEPQERPQQDTKNCQNAAYFFKSTHGCQFAGPPPLPPAPPSAPSAPEGGRPAPPFGRRPRCTSRSRRRWPPYRPLRPGSPAPASPCPARRWSAASGRSAGRGRPWGRAWACPPAARSWAGRGATK